MQLMGKSTFFNHFVDNVTIVQNNVFVFFYYYYDLYLQKRQPCQIRKNKQTEQTGIHFFFCRRRNNRIVSPGPLFGWVRDSIHLICDLQRIGVRIN